MSGASHGPRAAAGGHLLLVEDSDTQALMIRRVLERGGFSVERAASAEAALDCLNSAVPDLVVCDYHLPGMNGGELVRALRLNVRTRTVPVLMLTEALEPGLEREGLESGADAYVPKSSDQSLILLRIAALLRQNGAQPAGDRSGVASGFGREVGVFRRARILLLHETREAAETLAALLGREGYEAEIVADPAAGLSDSLSDGRGVVDCVVVDLQATRFDGIALCAALNARRAPAGSEPGSDPGSDPGGDPGSEPGGEPGNDTGRDPGRDTGRDPGREPGDPASAEAASAGGPSTSLRILGLGDGERPGGRFMVARAYGAGVDDVVPDSVGPEAIGLRVRAMVRRKLLQDETARIETELRGRQAAIDRAREEAAAHAAKAALAEALAETNEQLREAQGKLVQAAKMASLGELVAGIAHEINNPLAFILAHQGTVARLLDQLAADPAQPPGQEAASRLSKARERVASMSLGLKRIQNLVLNLRKFSRLDESEHQSVDVPDAIDTVLTLLTHKLGTGITVEKRFEAPRDLSCQPALLNQVIMNIVGNAADALNQDAARGGDAARTGSPAIRIATRLEAGQYSISIADNGPGVPDALRERVFEPFFTTKPVGSGTGLGLAIAYNVVRAHGGSIVLDTPEGGGARFVVSVPAGDAPAGDAPVAGAPADGVPVSGVAAAGAPIAGAPVADTPAGDAPVAGTPVGGVPVSGVAAAGAPIAGAPVADTPAGDAPIAGAPIANAPVADTPAGDAPVAGTPVGGVPVSGVAAAGAPIANAPIADTPAGDTPIADTPVAGSPVASSGAGGAAGGAGGVGA